MVFIPGPDSHPPLLVPDALGDWLGRRAPTRHWQVVRSLPTHTVFVGLDDDGVPRWTLKVGSPAMVARFRRQFAFARRLERLVAAGLLPDLDVPPLAHWRRGRRGGWEYLLTHWDPRPALGPERPLKAKERLALRAGLPSLVRLLVTFDAVPAGARTRDVRGLLWERIERHLDNLLTAGRICLGLEEALRRLAMPLEARLPGRLAHGDLTPWHVLSSGEGNLAVLDFEFARPRRPRFWDLSWVTLKIWACQCAPREAQELLRQALAAMGVEVGDYWRSAGLLAFERGLQGLDETLAWHADARAATDHLVWILGELVRVAVVEEESAAAVTRHLAASCANCGSQAA